MASLINIGVTGLKSHQTALSTVGNNIANANVEGYSRQEVNFSSRATQFIGTGFIGSGVQISGVNRIYNQFTAQQVVTDTSRFEALNVLSRGYQDIDNVLASESSGLSGVLNDLFSSIQSASESPGSLPLRQQVISEAERFLSRYNDINSVLEGTLERTNENITALVGEVNRISSGIAEFNRSISEQTLDGRGAPNDLLDKRDQLLRDLATKTDFISVKQDGDFVNVYLSSGEALVLGDKSNELIAVQGTQGANRVEVGIVASNGDVTLVSDALKGGQLGGELRLRDEGIDGVSNQLGLIATLAVSAFNVIQGQGVDLNRQAGTDLFTPIDDRQAELGRVQYVSNNGSQNAVASVSIDDVTRLRADEYRLEFDGASVVSFRLTRESDGAVVAEGVFSGSAPLSIATADGFAVNLEQGSYSTGDVLSINPTRLPAENIELLARPESLAFGLPISLEASDDNAGTGTILQPSSESIGALLQNEAAAGVALTTEPLLVRFTSPTTYDILDNSDPNNSVPFAPAVTGLAFVPGRTNTILSANDSSAGIAVGFDIEIGGVPQTGDEFFVSFESTGAGDNRNALALSELQSADLLGSGRGSLSNIYASLVGLVGVETSSAKVDVEAANSLLVRSTSQLQSESGVNLDEEAARLLQYEQAYNASAQVIAIARSIFDSLLSAFR